MDPNANSKGKGIWDKIKDKIIKEDLDGLKLPDYLEAFTEKYRQATTEKEKLEIFRPIVSSTFKKDKTERLHVVTALRRLLLEEPSLPSELIVRTGHVSLFVCLLMPEDSQLSFEAACVLNMLVASGTLEIDVTKYGDEPIFDEIELLKLLLMSSRDEFRGEVLYGMSRAAVLPGCRDSLLKRGAMDLILSQIDEDAEEPSLLIAVAFAISRMCRGEPRPPLEKTKIALPALENFVLHPTDAEVLGYACEALSYIYDGSNDIQINANVCKSLVDFLMDGVHHPVRLNALRTLGNVTLRDSRLAEAIISYGALKHLLSILTDINCFELIKLEACRFISKITAGKEKERIQSVIDAQLILPLITLLQTPEIDFKKLIESHIKNQNPDTAILMEACSAIANIIGGATHDQIFYLEKEGFWQPCMNVLSSILRNFTQLGKRSRED